MFESCLLYEQAVRQAFEEAKAGLTKTNTIQQPHEFITKHVGPTLLTGDGTIIQATQEGQATDLRYGHHAPPWCPQRNAIQAAFWRLWQQNDEAV